MIIQMNKLPVIFLFGVITFNACSLFDSDPESQELIGGWEAVAQKRGGERISVDSLDIPKMVLQFNAASAYQQFVADTLADSGTFSFFERRSSTLLELNSNTYKNSREFSFTFKSDDELELFRICPNCSVIPVIYKRTR